MDLLNGRKIMKNSQSGKRRNARHIANSRSRFRNGKGKTHRSLKFEFQKPPKN